MSFIDKIKNYSINDIELIQKFENMLSGNLREEIKKYQRKRCI